MAPQLRRTSSGLKNGHTLSQSHLHGSESLDIGDTKTNNPRAVQSPRNLKVQGFKRSKNVNI